MEKKENKKRWMNLTMETNLSEFSANQQLNWDNIYNEMIIEMDLYWIRETNRFFVFMFHIKYNYAQMFHKFQKPKICSTLFFLFWNWTSSWGCSFVFQFLWISTYSFFDFVKNNRVRTNFSKKNVTLCFLFEFSIDFKMWG